MARTLSQLDLQFTTPSPATRLWQGGGRKVEEDKLSLMPVKHVRGAAVLAALLFGLPTLGSGQGSDERYIVKFQRGKSASGKSALKAAGGKLLVDLEPQEASAAHIPAHALEGLRHNPNVEYIEADPRRYPMSQSTPYGIPMVQADQVVHNDAASKRVCIIDSGYYQAHEDLQDSGVTASPDSGTGDPFTDGCGHGTHVAGTVAAQNNALGVVGVVPSGGLNIHVVKVFGDTCSWTYSSNLINALNKCRQAGAHVVSMSLGCTGAFCRSTTEENAFNDANSAGVLSVAAAGNDGNTGYSYPASYSSVVSVAAIDANKVVADFSQKNDQVDLAAPGVGVLSTVPFVETNTLSAGGATYSGGYIDGAARTAGTSGLVADGGLCDSNGNGAWAAKVVLCQRGTISFATKVANVQSGGASAAVIYNNVPGGFSGTLNGTSAIPAISLSQADGQAALLQVGQPGTVVSQRQQPASGYEAWNGTSMATPHVSGVAALIWSHHPNKTNADIRRALELSAQDLGTAGRDDSYGHGLVQARAALDLLDGGGVGDTTPPAISNVASRKLKGPKFEITWTTDEASTSEVSFVGDGTFTNSSLVTSHRMNFRGTSGATYQYFVSSTDAAGNRATAGPFTHQN